MADGGDRIDSGGRRIAVYRIGRHPDRADSPASSPRLERRLPQIS